MQSSDGNWCQSGAGGRQARVHPQLVQPGQSMSFNNLNKTKSEWMLNTKIRKQDRFYSSKFKHSYLRTQTRKRNLQ